MERHELEPLLILDEAAAYLRLSPRKLANLARLRQIASMKAGRTWVFPASGLREYVAKHAHAHDGQHATAGATATLPPPPLNDPYERTREGRTVSQRNR